MWWLRFHQDTIFDQLNKRLIIVLSSVLLGLYKSIAHEDINYGFAIILMGLMNASHHFFSARRLPVMFFPRAITNYIVFRYVHSVSVNPKSPSKNLKVVVSSDSVDTKIDRK